MAETADLHVMRASAVTVVSAVTALTVLLESLPAPTVCLEERAVMAETAGPVPVRPANSAWGAMRAMVATVARAPAVPTALQVPQRERPAATQARAEMARYEDSVEPAAWVESKEQMEQGAGAVTQALAEMAATVPPETKQRQPEATAVRAANPG